MNINIGDKVRIKTSLKRGLGVCKEQLMYKGNEYIVAFKLGYNAVLLKGNDFVWNQEDLEVID